MTTTALTIFFFVGLCVIGLSWFLLMLWGMCRVAGKTDDYLEALCEQIKREAEEKELHNGTKPV